MTVALIRTSLPGVVESMADVPEGFRTDARCVGCSRPIAWEPYGSRSALVNGALVRPGCWTCPTCYRAREEAPK